MSRFAVTNVSSNLWCIIDLENDLTVYHDFSEQSCREVTRILNGKVKILPFHDGDNTVRVMELGDNE